MPRKPESQFIYTNPIQRKIMLKPTSNLRGLPTSLTNRCAVFIVLESLCRILGKNQLYTYLTMLGGATFIGRRVRQGMYTIRGKASCTLTQVVKDTRYWLHWLQSSSRSVHNSRKTSCTLIRLANARLPVTRIVIQYTILGKTFHSLYSRFASVP